MQNAANGKVMPYPLLKMLLIMKFLSIFVLAACLQVHAGVTAQTVTLKAEKYSLEKVLREVKKQTHYDYFLTSRLAGLAKPITIVANQLPLDQFLKACFQDQPVTYELSDKSIIIKEKKAPVVTEGLNPRLDPTPPPPIDVTITVLNTDNQPLEGASIIIKGSNKGIATDINGRASLRGVDANATIIISFTGYASQEYKLSSNPGLKSGVNNPTPVVIRLIASANELNEVIVNKGYYTEKQKLSTSNVGQVTAKDIQKQPVNNPLLALQGRVPSLNIIQNSGFSGSGVDVKIQGQATINFGVGNDPLYVVDGVPYPSRMLTTLRNIQGSSGEYAPDVAGSLAGAGNPLSFINPSDIESIDVLKDADATAIYGSRAANGAILITTKKGKAGQTKVDINMQSGWAKMTRRLDVLNTQEFLEMRKEAFKNDGLTLPTTPATTNYDLTIYDQNKYTDWQDVLLGGTAHYNDVHASVSGGTANTQILIGTGYHKETTVIPGDFANRKGSVHFNINNISNNRKFRVQLSGSYMVGNNKIMDRDPTQDAVSLAPNAPDLYNADGSLNWMRLPNGNVTWTNPLAFLLIQYNQKTSNLVSNAEVSYQILPGLNIKSSFGYTNMQTTEELLIPLISYRPDRWPTSQRISAFNNNNINSWIVEPQLSYKRNILKGKFEVLLGTTIHQNNSNLEVLQGSGYTSDLDLRNIAIAPTKVVRNRGVSVYKYNAIFTRINYNWDEKYILNLSARRDGSSRFGSESQFHNFGSIGAAWLFSSESFIKNNFPFLSFGKLRASYGITGNDQIGDYRFLSLYGNISVPTQYQGAVGITPTSLPNPFLQWEETKKFQFGLDLAFLKDRIIMNANYYRNRTSSELLSYNLPITAGFTSIARNFPATVQNNGWEFSINATSFSKKDFKWTTNVNLTIPKNKLVSFPNLVASSYANQLVIGQPITIIKLYHIIGVNATTGAYDFADKDGNPVSYPNYLTDRTVLADRAPKFYGGLQNTFSYKGFELDVLFQYVNQKAFNVFYGYNQVPGQYFGANNVSNQPVSVLQRWRKPGDISKVQLFSTDFNYLDGFEIAGASDGAFGDASYLRLKNVSLSWQIPEKLVRKIHLQSGRIYVNGQNLLTTTKYVGLDPETRSSLTLPPLRVITMGINVSL